MNRKGHVKPDADALGSSLGLAGYLLKLGHQVRVITPTDYPEFLNWMEGNEDVLVFEKDKEKSSYLVEVVRPEQPYSTSC